MERFVRGLGDGSPSGVQGRSPGRGLGTKSPRSGSIFIKLHDNFDVFDHETVQHVRRRQWATSNTRDQRSAVRSVAHDCRAEEHVNNAHVIYTTVES